MVKNIIHCQDSAVSVIYIQSEVIFNTVSLYSDLEKTYVYIVIVKGTGLPLATIPTNVYKWRVIVCMMVFNGFEGVGSTSMLMAMLMNLRMDSMLMVY